MINLNELNRYRIIEHEIALSGQIGDENMGVFKFISLIDRKRLLVIASSEAGWDHVSVSCVGRTPRWAEMELVKRTLFKPDEVVMQLHVPEDEHISYHDFCLHLWRPHGIDIPRPPSWMVGPTKAEEEKYAQRFERVDDLQPPK